MNLDQKMLDALWEEINNEYSSLDFVTITEWYADKKRQNIYNLEEEGSCEKEKTAREIECNFYKRAATVLTKPEEDQMIN